MDEEKVIDAEFVEVSQESAEQPNDVTTDTAGGQAPPLDGSNDKIPPNSDGVISDLANSKGKMEETRSVIAFRFIVGFFGVIFLVFVTGWSGIFKETAFKDMLLTIVGTLSSSLGFIIGYYFKSSEEKIS